MSSHPLHQNRPIRLRSTCPLPASTLRMSLPYLADLRLDLKCRQRLDAPRVTDFHRVP